MMYIPVIVLLVSGLAWILTRMYRTLPTTDELLRRLLPDQMKPLQDLIPHDPIRDLLDSDLPFWDLSGGYEGLWKRRANAICYIQLCQRLELEHKMPKEDVRYVSRRAFWQAFFTVACIPEGFVRIFFRIVSRGSLNVPHACARWATYFYWELSNRAETLNLQFGNANWISHA